MRKAIIQSLLLKLS